MVSSPKHFKKAKQERKKFPENINQQMFQRINERTEEISGVAGWEYDVTTDQVFMTHKAYDIYGLSTEKNISLDANKDLYDEESLAKIDAAITNAIAEAKPYEIELNLSTPDKNNKTIRVNGYPLLENDEVTKLYGTLEDITEEKKEKKEREEIVQKLKMAQKIAKIGYWKVNIIEDTGEWSEEVCDIYGVDHESFVPNLSHWMQLIHPEDRESVSTDFKKIFESLRYYDFEHRIITPEGQVKWVLERITIHTCKQGHPQIIEGISQDITERKKQEKKILEALTEKETLLAEIHHRVKNNLAVVSGMMQLQAFEENSETVRNKLLDSVGRIVSMASIHEQLYSSDSFSKLDFSNNLKSLIRKISDSMQAEPAFALEFDLEPVQLNVNQAIPYSLIVNEVITNIIKHAFTVRDNGKVWVKLSEDRGVISLSIEDNGRGMPQGVDISKNNTLGLRLIGILAQQLEARYYYDSSDRGTAFFIEFEKSELQSI